MVDDSTAVLNLWSICLVVPEQRLLLCLKDIDTQIDHFLQFSIAQFSVVVRNREKKGCKWSSNLKSLKIAGIV